MNSDPRFWAGLALALIGGAIMFEGSLFGDDTSGIAIVIGILGIGLIATSKRRLLK